MSIPSLPPLLNHNLYLDRKQRDGASVLMNNNRNWEREKARNGVLRKPPLKTACLAGTLSVYLPDCQHLCVSVCVSGLALNQHFHRLCSRAHLVWLIIPILRPMPSRVSLRIMNCALFCLSASFSQHLPSFLHLECLYHLALCEMKINGVKEDGILMEL